MRLLNARKVFIAEVYDVDALPYAILSYTWSAEEIILQDIQNSSSYGGPCSDSKEQSFCSLKASKSKGFSEIPQNVILAAHDGYENIWIDTCCIDKASSVELSEAINSMFQWYTKANTCYAYLADVAPARAEGLSALKSFFCQRNTADAEASVLFSVLGSVGLRESAPSMCRLACMHLEAHLPELVPDLILQFDGPDRKIIWLCFDRS
ncbi:hypothetical protein ACHAPA_002410 [Fusarium lateritium]